ncbi:DUF815 domain-containing protein [Sphingomonas sp. RS2018]
MTDTDPILARIAAALERLAPVPPEPADLTRHAAYIWDGSGVTVARGFAPVPLDLLTGMDAQKTTLLANLERHAAGLPAHDALLWGARGTGKSALVASAAAQAGVALVEVAAASLDRLPALFALLEGAGRPFAVFVDDLGFASPAEGRALRSLLEGGAAARPANVRLLVTSNRRHLVPRDIEEQSSAINPRDTVDDALALADRFGLSIGFHVIDQDTYVAIVARYLAAHGLTLDAQDAVRWATVRGSRSGRVAWQYVVELAGREGKRLA